MSLDSKNKAHNKNDFPFYKLNMDVYLRHTDGQEGGPLAFRMLCAIMSSLVQRLNKMKKYPVLMKRLKLVLHTLHKFGYEDGIETIKAFRKMIKEYLATSDEPNGPSI